MKQARDDIGGDLSAYSSPDPAAGTSSAVFRAQVIELKPSVTDEGIADERGPFLSGRLTLLRMVSGIIEKESEIPVAEGVFGDEDEDYEDDFDDEDDEEDDELDEDDEDELDDEDEEDDDDFEDEDEDEDVLDDEEDEDEVFEGELDDD